MHDRRRVRQQLSPRRRRVDAPVRGAPEPRSGDRDLEVDVLRVGNAPCLRPGEGGEPGHLQRTRRHLDRALRGARPRRGPRQAQRVDPRGHIYAGRRHVALAGPHERGVHGQRSSVRPGSLRRPARGRAAHYIGHLPRVARGRQDPEDRDGSRGSLRRRALRPHPVRRGADRVLQAARRRLRRLLLRRRVRRARVSRRLPVLPSATRPQDQDLSSRVHA
mmetsp:Transcript_32783/g.98810  ORF Transcript_32783/g.98810 Transcript_32783/m.98810 type:complete len:219 (-) Transcript_32783:73-729(-)